MTDRLVSLVMPVYNRPALAREAIDSILGQTYANLELIVVDDGSGPETIALLEGYADPRFQLIRQANQGPAIARNRAIEVARGHYLAFMDSDDVAMADRLRLQVEFLERNPGVGLVGTAAQIWEDAVPTRRMLAHPLGDRPLQRALLFDNPFVASSVMVRRDVWDRVGPFDTDPDRLGPEDYEQWARLARGTRVANLPDALVIYREVAGSVSRRDPAEFQRRVFRIAVENLIWAADLDASDPAPLAIVRWVHGVDPQLPPEVPVARVESLLTDAFTRVTAEPRAIAAIRARRFVSWIRLRRAAKRLRGSFHPGAR